MHQVFHDVPSVQKHKARRLFPRTALSLFVGGLFYSAAPAWADCTVSSTPNANGGVDMTCEGTDIKQDTSQLGNQNNNNVTVQGEGTTVKFIIYGGSSYYGGHESFDITVSGNTVTLNDSSSASTVFGGHAQAQGYGAAITVSGNSVVLNGEGIFSSIYGGYGSSIDYTNGTNRVSVSGNTVTLNNGSRVNNYVYGGSGSGSGERDGDIDITVSGNAVTLNDSSSANSVYGGSGKASSDADDVILTVSDNAVTLNDSSSANIVYGGYGVTNSDADDTVLTSSHNAVTLNDSSSASAVYGGYGIVNWTTGYADMTLRDNIVTLNDSSRAFTVYGGYGIVSWTTGYADITLRDNIVTLNDSSSASTVYGGYGSIDNSKADIMTVSGNTVNINDTAFVTNSLYGGFIDNPPDAASYDAFTGNTLNFAAAPITLSGDMANFENYNFTLDPALANVDTALITAGTITFGTNDTNMNGGDANTSKIQVVGIKSGNELFIGDDFLLMEATNTLSGEGEALTTRGVAQQGISLLYDVKTTIHTDSNRVTATIIGAEDPNEDGNEDGNDGEPAARVNPQLKALSEGHLASAMMLTRGADTLAYHTVHTIQHQNPEKGLAPFITLSGGKNRYNSGSHINAKDSLLTGGLSYQTDKLTGAVLIESGWGSYNTHNGFETMKDVNGDGHNRYVGAAVLGHYDFDSGLYAEASLRAGKNRNTFDTKDIINLSTGEYARYNLDSNYLGAHIGTGYSKTLDAKNTADVSAKYLWTQLKGKNVNVADDNIHFNDINSHRVRMEAGLSHQYTETVALRAGLGYEYEFDGKAKATTYGYDIAAPGMQGSTGILTLGSTVTPLATQPLSVDINLNGYTGKRDGVGGGIKFSYAF
ncbi:TPA: hypothetical protein ACS7ZY_003633 [Providencia alcalifaciens]